ncbi:hypothetical protein [uncultured Clostridium sp.]|uniref:hypothetical protein n=1 Tax=uncultured Clostridium sp. TaxID=59620 RepID=UPI002636F5D9|nr:hypothetical protein [uncultured Clostridium sp.]
MSRYSKVSKVAKCGAVDSKYFNDSEQFEKDIQSKIDKANEFRAKIRALVLEDPNLIEHRINLTVSELLKIKREFDV